LAVPAECHCHQTPAYLKKKTVANSEFAFPRQSRLLNAADYSPVFSDAEYKVSNRQFLLLARSNTLGRSRIGLVIAKKHVPLAVQRNRIKRLLRTAFRLNQQALGTLDIVVLARNKPAELDNKTLTHQINKLWSDLARKSQADLS